MWQPDEILWKIGMVFRLMGGKATAKIGDDALHAACHVGLLERIIADVE